MALSREGADCALHRLDAVLLNWLTTNEVFLNDTLEDLWCARMIPHIVGLYHDDRTHDAET
jgi:hypothetical protein